MPYAARLSAAAVAAALLILGALAAVALIEMDRWENATSWTLHTRDVLAQSDLIGQLLSDAESAARGYAVTGQIRFAEKQRAAAREFPAISSGLAALVQDNPEQRRRAADLQALVDVKLGQTTRIIDARTDAGADAAQRLIQSGEGYGSMERVHRLLIEFKSVEEALLRDRVANGQQRAQTVRRVLVVLGGAAALFLLLSWMLTLRAVQSLRAAQTRARFGEARLLSTLQSCGDGLIVTDEAGMVMMLNPVAQALTGWREDQARGVPLDEVFRIVNEFTRETVESPVSRVLREGKVVGLANHTVLVARDGTERPIDDSGAPIKDQLGGVIGVVLVFRDVTGRKLSEQARERLLRAEAERSAAVLANEAKDEFLAVISHELRSPLAAIRGWLHLLMGGFLPVTETQGALVRIYRNARLQERLINDLLDISRIVAGKLEVIRSPVDLIAIVQTALDECKWTAEQKAVQLGFERNEPRLHVMGDEQRLAQSIGNVLTNAIKFTSSGGSVRVTAGRHDDQAIVTVRDTGVGMSPEILEHLFERFWQADTSKTRQHGGLGLGLAVTKYFIDEHEGSICAESTGPGEGSTFTIALPLLESGSGQTSTTSSTAAGKDLSDVRVLIVDDDIDSRDAVELFLSERGAVIRAASSVQEALEVYEAHHPSVVVTDIGMPNEDGYALVAEIRRRDAAAKRLSIIIALTGFGGHEERVEALQRGLDVYLTKPIDLEELVMRIRAGPANQQRGS